MFNNPENSISKSREDLLSEDMDQVTRTSPDAVDLANNTLLPLHERRLDDKDCNPQGNLFFTAL